MLPPILLCPDPGYVVDNASTDDILQALRATSDDDPWTEEALQLFDFVLVSWVSDSVSGLGRNMPIPKLQTLIDYALTRAKNHASIPDRYRARWGALNNVMESRRRIGT